MGVEEAHQHRGYFFDRLGAARSGLRHALGIRGGAQALEAFRRATERRPGIAVERSRARRGRSRRRRHRHFRIRGSGGIKDGNAERNFAAAAAARLYGASPSRALFQQSGASLSRRDQNQKRKSELDRLDFGEQRLADIDAVLLRLLSQRKTTRTGKPRTGLRFD